MTGKRLQEVVVERAGIENHPPLLGETQIFAYEVVKFDSPASWRLTETNADTEATFRIQGILCAFDLPPITNNNGLQRRRYHIRQAVTLTGLSTDMFAKASVASKTIYETMKTNFPDGKVNHWENTAYEGHIASDYNARYFTSRSSARNETNLPFLEGVDPAGVLAGLRRQDLIHGPDNQVKYLAITKNGGYQTTTPIAFRIGDIVETTIAFVVLPIKGDRYIMVPQLRALTLLESVVPLINTQKEPKTCRHLGKLKRKSVYSAVNETSGKMAKMQIDGN